MEKQSLRRSGGKEGASGLVEMLLAMLVEAKRQIAA